LTNKLSVLETRAKSTSNRLTKSSKIIKTIIKAIYDKKGENVVSLDLRKIHEAVADFFIVCEANNPSLLKAVADEVEYMVKKECEELPYKHEGRQAQQWILIDYVNVVVHVMLPEQRKFYGLEELWSDGTVEEHAEEGKPKVKVAKETTTAKAVKTTKTIKEVKETKAIKPVKELKEAKVKKTAKVTAENKIVNKIAKKVAKKAETKIAKEAETKVAKKAAKK
jgi:ribosome-associated protein